MKRASYANRLVRMILRGYQRAISPLLPRACRYVPTCSEYALEAVERHGAIRGGLLAAWRVLRCHPFAGSGYDPVPDVLGVTPDHGRTHKHVFTGSR
jgi:uncharacterized protein